jgi:hypothetical protein
MFIYQWHQVSEIVPVIQNKLNKADDCRSQGMAGKKSKNLRRKPSVKFWLLTPTQNQVLSLVMLKTILRRRRRISSPPPSAEVEPQAATSGRLPTWGTTGTWVMSTVLIVYLHVGLNIPTEVSGSFW